MLVSVLSSGIGVLSVCPAEVGSPSRETSALSIPCVFLLVKKSPNLRATSICLSKGGITSSSSHFTTCSSSTNLSPTFVHLVCRSLTVSDYVATHVQYLPELNSLCMSSQSMAQHCQHRQSHFLLHTVSLPPYQLSCQDAGRALPLCWSSKLPLYIPSHRVSHANLSFC